LEKNSNNWVNTARILKAAISALIFFSGFYISTLLKGKAFFHGF